MGKTIARSTITLERPLNGKEVADAVKAYMESRSPEDSKGFSFEHETHYVDGLGYIVGQGSGYRDMQLCVVSTVDELGLLKVDETYDKLLVRECAWGTRNVYSVISRPALVITTVREFANGLKSWISSNT